MRATDEQIMQALSEGDLEAFHEIVLRYQSLGWKTAFRFLGDAMEAEDVTQETFLKIFEAAPRYRPSASFRTYFYRVLTHLCVDRARKKHPSNLIDIPDMPDSSLGPTEIFIEEERRAQIRKAIDTLPPSQRAAIILRHYEGLGYAEIAQILGVTPKAVERLLSRARASLQAGLSQL
jgi:RNA polymerase sigma-70 factor, ECF subfamily